MCNRQTALDDKASGAAFAFYDVENGETGNRGIRSAFFLIPKKPQFLWEEETPRSVKNPTIPQYGGILERSVRRRQRHFAPSESGVSKLMSR